MAGSTRPAADAATVLEARGLGKRFGFHTALDGVDLALERGSFVTLFGPNGAGKTTLVRCLATLAHPTSGEVRILGTPARKASAEVRGRLGVVSHESFLYGALTARENLLFYARMFDVPEPEVRTRRVLEQVGLLARSEDEVRTFSRGLKQRCSIARALVHDPGILLFDEPFSGLDPVAADQLSDLLATAREGGRTVLMTSHDLRRGFSLATRVAILAGGRLVHDGPREGIDADGMAALYQAAIRGERP